MTNNKNIHRMDIWEANFDNNYESVITGKHACIIVSSWKVCIRKTGSVMVIPLTSNLTEYTDAQIIIEGYNLKKRSKALCNQVTTIDKKNLLFKIGEMNNPSVQIKLESAIEKQLQLKQNNFNAFDLENLFVDSNNTIKSGKVKLQRLKAQLFESHKNKRYTESIGLADNLKDLALSLKSSDISQDFLWYSVYMHGLSDLYLGNLESAMKNVQESFSYIKNPSEFGNNYSLSLYLTANIAEDMKDIPKACRIYQALTTHYKSNNETILRISTLYNVALMKNNHKAMKNIYKILEKVITTNSSIYSNEEYKQELLLEMRTELDTFGI